MGLQFELVHYSCYTNMQVVSAISRGYKYLFTTILMKRYRVFSLLTPCLVLSSLAVAQTPSTASSFPRLVRFSGTASDIKGNPLTGAVGITFSLYSEQAGGASLWLETQNAQADSIGRYEVLLGATKPQGLPTDLFSTEQAQWLGVQVQGQAEQPRVLLLSVPYALKARDAETIGGLPPSAFVLATPLQSAVSRPATAADSTSGGTPFASGPVTGAGTATFVPLWDSISDITNSAIFQSGSGTGAKIGINNTTPATTLDVGGNALVRGALELPSQGAATASAGFNSDPFIMLASSFNSTTAAPVSQFFEWQAEPAGNNTATPTGTLNLLFGAGVKPTETGMNIAGNGLIKFASGQTFPGAGTITGVTAGSGLVGGGTSGNVVVGLTTSCASGQVLQWNGSAWACAGTGSGSITSVTAGTDLTGGGSSGTVTLNLDTTKVPQLNAANRFTQPQTINSQAIVIAANTVDALDVTQAGFQATGDGIHGVTVASGGTGVFGQGAIGIQGLATPSTGLSGLFRGTVKITGNGNNLLAGDPGCGSGFAGLGFRTSGSLSGCTNYAVLGGSAGATFINSSGTAAIHFRSNNNELATIDNSGNVNVIGQNGGGSLTVAKNLTVAGKVNSSNVAAQVSASNSTGANVGACAVSTLTALNANCQVPNLTLTTTTTNPNVLVMVNIGGVSTDPCAIANFYLFIDGNIVALSSVSSNNNNSRFGFEVGSLNITTLQNLPSGSHTFQVQEATDLSGGNCNAFTSATVVSQGDGSRGSLRTLIVREF